jgi:hypothetical protein
VSVVNPPTWEAEIVGSQFKASQGKKVSETLSQRKSQAWWSIPRIPAYGRWRLEYCGVSPAWVKSVRPFW